MVVALGVFAVVGMDGVGGVVVVVVVVVVVFELRPGDVRRRAVGPGCAVRRGPLRRGGPTRRACCGGVEVQVRRVRGRRSGR